MVSNSMIQNCPITVYDVANTHTMFGPNLSGTRGKTAHKNPDRVVMDCVAVPKYVLKPRKFVTIVADMMFVNGAPFLITMSQGINFVTVVHISTCTANHLRKY